MHKTVLGSTGSKGNKKIQCEMCGKAATVTCQHCRVTFYCGKEHQSTDWFGIHEKICQLLGALRALRPTLGSEEERKRRAVTVQMSQNALVDLCKSEANKHLVAGRFELAVPGALQALRFLMDIHGPGHIELVPAYLLLAEANLGLKCYEAAEEFLVYANWAILKSSSCDNMLKSKLHGDFGKLYAAQGRLDDAIEQIAEQIYAASLEQGPEHIETAIGFYWMAKVLLSQDKFVQAHAFLDKVIDIWFKFLFTFTPESKDQTQEEPELLDYLSEADISESVDMLKSILEWRTERLGDTHMATAEAHYTLGLMCFANTQSMIDEAEQHLSKALGVFSLNHGSDYKSTKSIEKLLSYLRGEEQPQSENQTVAVPLQITAE